MDAEPDRTSPAPPSRRDVLRGLAAGGIAAFLAACSPAQPPSAPSAASVAPASVAPPSPAPSQGGGASPSIAPTPSPVDDLARRIAGLVIVGFRGSSLDHAGWVRTALARDGLGGVILFDRDQLTGGARNVVSPSQVARLTAELRAAAGSRRIAVGVDQEGGVVTRLGPAHGFPALASEASVGAGTTAQATRWAAGLVTTLVKAGIDRNFAPVVDLDVNPRSPAIGALGRSFSADPDVVVRMATIEIRAHRRADVRTVLKHFPGIGSSTANTDFGVADVTDTWTRTELEPFRRLIAGGLADVVMAGHVVNRHLDETHPASLSRAVVTGLLRGQLAWDGAVVTDDLQAAAITARFGADEAILLALEAGNDLLLFANQQVYDPGIVRRVVQVVLGAVAHGRITGAQIDLAYRRAQMALAPGDA